MRAQMRALCHRQGGPASSSSSASSSAEAFTLYTSTYGCESWKRASACIPAVSSSAPSLPQRKAQAIVECTEVQCSHICTATKLLPCPNLSLGLSAPLPNLHRDWAQPATSAPGLGSPRPHLHRDPAASASPVRVMEADSAEFAVRVDAHGFRGSRPVQMEPANDSRCIM